MTEAVSEVSKSVARRIIERVGETGQPPEHGFQYFTAGLDAYLDCLEIEYFADYIKDGGSAFKLVVGIYGGGKTHFLYCLRDIGWRHNYAVSYVVLSPESTPFFKLELVYKAIVNNLMAPLSPEELLSGYERGIAPFLRRWYAQRLMSLQEAGGDDAEIAEAIRGDLAELEGIESLSMVRAVRAAIEALIQRNDQGFEDICQWLNGEGFVSRVHTQYGILERVNKETAFKMIRSLTQVLRQMGFSGLVLLLDEAEQKSSMSTKQQSTLQSNLREVIDACGHTALQGVLIAYAVPDETFLEGRTQVYEALRQRLATVLEELNPTGVKIDLEKTVRNHIAFLEEVGRKLADVYRVAYACELGEADLAATISAVAKEAHEQRYADAGYKRLFVKMLVKALHYLRIKSQAPTPADFQVGA